tara:strand:+ start:2303 stop:2908 length:606 start_codon:yes stop_codon:yes gene_type:complete
MALLSKSIEDAFKANKAAAASGGGGNYLNAKDLNEENTVISFVGDEEQVLIRHIVWGTNRKPLKFTSPPKKEEIKERAEEEGVTLAGGEKSSALYAFTVWNYNEDRIQVFEFSQKGLANPIMEFLTDEEGKKTPHLFDLKLKAIRGKEQTDVTYVVLPVPGKRMKDKVNKEIDAAFSEVLEAGYDINALIDGGNPFSPDYN